jgi:hypothetical protein
VRGEPDGPIPFHYPAPEYATDLAGDVPPQGAREGMAAHG